MGLEVAARTDSSVAPLSASTRSIEAPNGRCPEYLPLKPRDLALVGVARFCGYRQYALCHEHFPGEGLWFTN